MAGLRATTQVATTGPVTNEMASHLPMAASWRRSTWRPGWVSLNASIIVMDEPTAALSAHEVDRLFEVIEMLRRDGAAVLFISHCLQAVFDVYERVTVMRDGRHVFTSPLAGPVADDLVQAIVGREVVDRPVTGGQQMGEVVLAVERLSREGVFSDVSFNGHAGEIVVLAGLVGSGRSEVARAEYFVSLGGEPPDRGIAPIPEIFHLD